MEVFKNSFDGGLDTNITQRLLPPNKYVDAANVNLAEDNEFYALENIKGTIEVKNIIDEPIINLLAVFPTKYKIGTTEGVNCLTIIAVTAGNVYKIWAYAVESTNLYELYETALTSLTWGDDVVMWGDTEITFED